MIVPFAIPLFFAEERTVMSRVCHFEIHAENPERAIAFYRHLFYWEFTSWGGTAEYWLIRTGPSTEAEMAEGTAPGGASVADVAATAAAPDAAGTEEPTGTPQEPKHRADETGDPKPAGTDGTTG